MKKILFCILLSVNALSTAWASDSVVIKQVGDDNVKFKEKSPELLQNGDYPISEEKKSYKTEYNKNNPAINLAVPERERTNIIINQQISDKNKANVNDINVKNDNMEELLKEEKKNVKHTRPRKSKKKPKVILDEEDK